MLKEVSIVVTRVGVSYWKRMWASFHLSSKHANVVLVTFTEHGMACLWPPTGVLYVHHISIKKF